MSCLTSPNFKRIALTNPVNLGVLCIVLLAIFSCDFTEKISH